MTLSRLFFLHSLVTLLAALVLILSPEAIPSTVHIRISAEQYLICYLLASSEFAISLLSFGATYLKDVRALRLISLSFIAFHLSSATVEVAILAESGSLVIWMNVIVRVIVAALFYYYGRYKLKHSTT